MHKNVQQRAELIVKFLLPNVKYIADLHHYITQKAADKLCTYCS